MHRHVASAAAAASLSQSVSHRSLKAARPKICQERRPLKRHRAAFCHVSRRHMTAVQKDKFVLQLCGIHVCKPSKLNSQTSCGEMSPPRICFVPHTVPFSNPLPLRHHHARHINETQHFRIQPHPVATPRCKTAHKQYQIHSRNCSTI